MGKKSKSTTDFADFTEWNGSFDPPVGPIGYARMFTPHRRPFKTKDGYICLMVITDDQWSRLLTALGRPELVQLPRFATLDQRTIHIDELYGTVAQLVAARTTEDWRQRLDAADVPNAPMNRLEDLPKDSYLVESGFFEHYNHPTEGALVRTPVTVRFSETPASVRLPPPKLGQHSREVFEELGYSDAEIAALCEAAAAKA